MKRTLGRPRHRWEENVERYLKEIRCELDVSGLGLQSNGRTAGPSEREHNSEFHE